MARHRYGPLPRCPHLEIRYMGHIERGGPRGGYRLRDGYSVFVDGRETQPWMLKRDAQAHARRIARGCGQPKMKIRVVR